MAGRSKSTAPVRMVRATPTLYSMGPLAVQLGRWATRDSSLTRSQRKAGRALELLGFRNLGEAGGGPWSRGGRPRADTHPLQVKLKWEAVADGGSEQ